MSDKKYFIGVDGGGSHTRAVIVNSALEIVAIEQTDGTNVGQVGFDRSVHKVIDLIQKVLHTSSIRPGDVEASVIGIAGLDVSSDVELFKTLVSEHFYIMGLKTPYVVNDIIIALQAGTDSKNAIAIIAGTGSNCFGINAEGQHAWVGGLGYLLSDEGSGYGIGVDVLRAAVRSYDGRILKTSLEKGVFDFFNARSPRELLHKVYADDFSKADFAKLSKIAFLNARDAISDEILRKHAKELVLLVTAAAHRLFHDKRNFDVVLTGGMFKNEPYIDLVKTGIEKAFSNAHVILPMRTSVWGAAKLASQAVNAPSLLGISPGE